MSAQVTAVILAAGRGQRMCSDIQKQYMLIGGKPVLYYSLRAFSESSADRIIVVTGEKERETVRREIVERYGFAKVRAVVAGGAERYESSMAGLRAAAGSGYVLIHDAARPALRVEIIERVIKAVKEYRAAIVGVPAKDTMKLVDEEGCAVETVPRSHLWTVQTPQAFSYELICRAYRRMEREETCRSRITDDAMVVETYGDARVRMVEGDSFNMKLTTPEDIALAEAALSQIGFF